MDLISVSPSYRASVRQSIRHILNKRESQLTREAIFQVIEEELEKIQEEESKREEEEDE